MPKPRVVSREGARRIAVNAQLLNGRVTGVLDTVRRLGYLQLDPISVVAPPQHMVLFSRLGARYDRAELERLLWVERELFEWNAFLWPKESLPIIRAWMRKPRTGGGVWAERVAEFLKTNAKFRRYVLRELETRGPLPSRELSDHHVQKGWASETPWWGERKVSLVLEMMHRRGEVAVVGRVGSQRLWGLGAAWYPECESLTLAEANRRHDEQRFRALGVHYDKRTDRWLAHPDADDSPAPQRAVLLSPFDRLIHNRDRTEALWDFRYRLEMYVTKAKREFGYYVLPLLVGDTIVGRAEPVFEKKTGTLRLLGAWGDTTQLDKALADLGAWLGATSIER
jgi:uncharacterized protein YcaQ